MLGQIAIRLPSAANRVIAALVDFIDHDVDYVKSETVVVMKGELCVVVDAWHDGVSGRRSLMAPLVFVTILSLLRGCPLQTFCASTLGVLPTSSRRCTAA